MATATVVKRISKEGKKMSLDKWDAIVLRTESGEDFIDRDYFQGLPVVDLCGYCHEFLNTNDIICCRQCSLYENKICEHDNNEMALFWQYVNEMRKYFDKKLIDRQKVIKLSRQIRDFIKNDPAEGE